VSNFFMSEEAYQELQEERQPRVYGWSSAFNTYEEYCAYSGLDTPEQEAANAQHEYEQWLENMTPEERAEHEAYLEQGRERMRCIEEIKAEIDLTIDAWDEHPF
jgi:hypothetical protein